MASQTVYASHCLLECILQKLSIYKEDKNLKISRTQATYICQNAALLETLIYSINCLVFITECLVGSTDWTVKCNSR